MEWIPKFFYYELINNYRNYYTILSYNLFLKCTVILVCDYSPVYTNAGESMANKDEVWPWKKMFPEASFEMGQLMQVYLPK